MRDGNVAARSFQFRAAPDLARADVAPPGAQRSVSGNVTHDDVAASGEGREVAPHIENLNVSAFGFQLGRGTSPRRISDSRRADAPRLDVSALRVKRRRSDDVSRGYVTRGGR